MIGGSILVSDKQGRLKPCRRCGYSLAHIAGARNCPECGLAVRISLSDNSGLEWSSPRWQRFMAIAFGVLALGLLCQTAESAGDWLLRLGAQGYYKLGGIVFEGAWRLSQYDGQAAPIVCGLALCLLSKGERRYPDRTVGARRIVLVAGLVVLGLGVFRVVIWNELLPAPPEWLNAVVDFPLSRPLIPPVVSVLACTYAADLAKRGHSRLLSKLSRIPLYPAAAGVVFWLMGIDQLFWPMRSIIRDWLFPLSMAVMLTVTVRVLARGAREADLNWVSN